MVDINELEIGDQVSIDGNVVVIDELNQIPGVPDATMAGFEMADDADAFESAQAAMGYKDTFGQTAIDEGSVEVL